MCPTRCQAWVFLTLVVLLSLRPVRRLSFELFKFSHLLIWLVRQQSGAQQQWCVMHDSCKPMPVPS